MPAKNFKVTLLFVDLSKTFDSIHRGEMEQIPLPFGLHKETFAAIIMLYKNTKVKVRSLDFFDIVAGVLQEDTLAPYLFIICLDYVLGTSIDFMKENGFTLAQAKSRWYPAWTITDTNFADDVALLANISVLAELLLHSLEREAGSIGVYVNTDMCFNQRGDIFRLGLWNLWTSSPTLEAASHLLKMTSTRD